MAGGGRKPHVKPRLFRDPIHDILAFEPDTVEGRLLIALIDTPELQRLRRIAQLALNNLVFYGAEHSRFTHSIGVAWLAGRMLDQLGQRAEFDRDARLTTVAAALLHDVGHGPFSHALEHEGQLSHEERSVGIVLHPQTGVNRVLSALDPELPARVAARIVHRGEGPGFLDDVVSSQLDADRLDYILRDGHATGVRIGSYDVARILSMLDVAGDRLAVHLGALEAVEGYLLARFHMYKQVYLHKTARAAERMLAAALRRARVLREDGYRFGYWPGGALDRLLRAEPLDHAEFTRLDDLDLWMCLKRWRDEEDRALADLAGGLVERRLWKTLLLPSDDDRRAEEMVAAARSIARVKGFDPEIHVLVDESRDSPYRPFTGLGTSGRSIRLVDKSGRAWFIEDRSDVVQMLGRLTHAQKLICFHPDLREPLERLAP